MCKHFIARCYLHHWWYFFVLHSCTPPAPTHIIRSNLCDPTGLRNVKTYSQCDGKKWWGKKKRNKWLEISWGGISLLNLSISHYLRPWQGTSDQPTANLHCTSEKPPKNLQNLYQKKSRINTENREKFVFLYVVKMYIIGRFSSPCHNSGCLVVWAVGLSPPRVPLREKVGHKCKRLWKFICDAYIYGQHRWIHDDSACWIWDLYQKSFAGNVLIRKTPWSVDVI